MKDKKYSKATDHCHYDTREYRSSAHSICDLEFSVPKVFRNISNDYHFIIKELAEEFKKQFSLGENTGKYKLRSQ